MFAEARRGPTTDRACADVCVGKRAPTSPSIGCVRAFVLQGNRSQRACRRCRRCRSLSRPASFRHFQLLYEVTSRADLPSRAFANLFLVVFTGGMSDGGSEDLGVLVAGCRQPDSPHSEGPRGCRSSEPPRQSWPVCSVGKRNGLRFRSRSRQITGRLFESGGFQRDDAAGGSRPPWASRQPSRQSGHPTRPVRLQGVTRRSEPP